MPMLPPIPFSSPLPPPAASICSMAVTVGAWKGTPPPPPMPTPPTPDVVSIICLICIRWRSAILLKNSASDMPSLLPPGPAEGTPEGTGVGWEAALPVPFDGCRWKLSLACDCCR